MHPRMSVLQLLDTSLLPPPSAGFSSQVSLLLR